MFAKELNTPEPLLREMYWYDIILIADTYNEMMEESENNNTFKEEFETQKDDMMSHMNSMKSSMENKIPNIGNISSGFKFPTL